MNKQNVLKSLIALVVALPVLMKGTVGSVAAAESTTPSQKVSSAFGEWFAVGSGCRATHKAPGNVSFQGQTFEKENTIRGRFELTGYKLSSPPEDPKTSITFARECNLRVQIQTPPGKRIVGVSSRSVVVVSKDANTKVSLQNTLYMDTRMVGAFQTEFPKGEKVGNRDFEITLNKGLWQGVPAQSDAAPVEYACGQAMVFGSDFTAIAHRSDPKDAALVQLGGAARSAEFAIELADCTSTKK